MATERIAVTVDTGVLTLARNMAAQTSGNLSAYVSEALASKVRKDGAAGIAALLNTTEGRQMAADMSRGTDALAALDRIDQDAA